MGEGGGRSNGAGIETDDFAARRWWPVLLVGVAAVGLLLWWNRPSPRSPEPTAQGPRWSLVAIQGGLTASRASGVPKDVPRFRPTSSIELLFEPRGRVRSAVDVQVLARRRQALERLDVGDALEVSPSGSVRIRGRFDEVFGLAPGAWELLVLIDTSGSLPPSAETTRDAVADDVPDPWFTHVQRIEVVPAR